MDPITGGALGPQLAPKGKRFAAGLVDLIIIPFIAGLILGFAMLNVPEPVRSLVAVLLNMAWLIFRDSVYSPGRAMVGLKLISLTGEKVSLAQAFIRNILLIIPFVVLIGSIVEVVALLVKGERVADGWAKTRVASIS